MHTAYLIDYSNWRHKFLKVRYSREPVRFPKLGKRDLSALRGFIHSIRSIDADSIYIALDGYPKSKLSMRPEYKSGRQHSLPDIPPLETKYVLAALQHYANNLGKTLYICYCPFEEADSVISALAYNCLGEVHESSWSHMRSMSMYSMADDIRLSSMRVHVQDQIHVPCYQNDKFDRVIIGSSDSDLYQCKEMGPVYFDRSTTGSDIDLSDATPKAVMNLPPHCIAIYKACCGDKSDNIPATISSILKKPLVRMLMNLSPGEANFFENDLVCAPNLSTHLKLEHIYHIVDTSGVYDYFCNNWKAHSEFIRNLRMVKLPRFLPVEAIIYEPDFTARCASLFAKSML